MPFYAAGWSSSSSCGVSAHRATAQRAAVARRAWGVPVCPGLDGGPDVHGLIVKLSTLLCQGKVCRHERHLNWCGQRSNLQCRAPHFFVNAALHCGGCPAAACPSIYSRRPRRLPLCAPLDRPRGLAGTMLGGRCQASVFLVTAVRQHDGPVPSTLLLVCLARPVLCLREPETHAEASYQHGEDDATIKVNVDGLRLRREPC